VLLRHDANPNDVFKSSDGYRHSLLIDAIIAKNEPFALLLIEKGANVTVVDEQGNYHCILQTHTVM
jgi:ankyrin repeat protein